MQSDCRSARFTLTGIPSGLMFALKSSNWSGEILTPNAASNITAMRAHLNNAIMPPAKNAILVKKTLRNQGHYHVLRI